jgi:phage terminase large subunit GpA-like protein
MIVQPTIMAAQDYSKDRIVPMIRDSAVLEKIFDNKAATLLHKPFLGGHLTLMGANSPTQLASRPIKILLIDEEDRMRVTSEGDPVAIAMKRTTTFRDRKIVHISTPSLKGLSRIERHFLQSDQRKRFVPCPYCHHYQELRWSQVKWDKSGERHLSKTAAYECEKCKVRWSEKERFIALAKGVWRATNDDPVDGKVGFHISELYSLWRTMPQIVQDFLNCTDNPDLLQVFYNTALGVPYERIVSGVSLVSFAQSVLSFSWLRNKTHCPLPLYTSMLLSVA